MAWVSQKLLMLAQSPSADFLPEHREKRETSVANFISTFANK
jgi:hypothetical protein